MNTLKPSSVTRTFEIRPIGHAHPAADAAMAEFQVLLILVASAIVFICALRRQKTNCASFTREMSMRSSRTRNGVGVGISRRAYRPSTPYPANGSDRLDQNGADGADDDWFPSQNTSNASTVSTIQSMGRPFVAAAPAPAVS